MEPNTSRADRLARAAALSRAHGPPQDAVARMRGALQVAGTAPAAHGHTITHGATRLARSTLARWAAVAVVGAAAVSGLAIHHARSPVHASAVEQPTPIAPRTVSTAQQAAAPLVVDVPSVSIEDLPRVVEAPPAHATAPKIAAAPTAESELSIVQKAQSALASDPALALSLAERHASEYPRGELTQERELVAIDALAKLGRAADAEARASRFLADNPNTPYRLRVERALGHSP